MALALYRRYRPDTFDGVIGQQQVTEPLCRALDNNRLTHAYLFSGPRGCGKTSSARILARCVNCAKGPTSHPCGECESCRELAANGPGSIDVMEIDAASHNGVEDARDLRERVTFGPARDRYKIIILDEAHMVTPQSFNALLKTVEEPPDNVMFIFATTEPDKVISTIRSRTHHYPFRLVPPEIMGPYLEKVCEKEGITPAQGVLRLVMRAGGGSVRDTLSVLDQLMVGAEGNEITYESAVRLLGFTPDSLIGEAVDAVIDSDGAKLYGIVNKVVVGGYEPKKFVDDLLARVRDLTVLTLAGEQAEKVLSDDVRVEDGDELRRQASALGLAKLTWMAETINDTLEQMTGAISPRMRLELLAAKLLVPADQRVVSGPAAGGPVAGGQMAAGGQPQGGAPSFPTRSFQAQPGQAQPGQTQRLGGVAAPAASASRAPAANGQTANRGISNTAGLNAALAAMSAPQASATAPMVASAAAQGTAVAPGMVAAQGAAVGTAPASASAPAPMATPASVLAPMTQAQVDELWDKSVASLPDDARVFLDREQVPHVSLIRDPRNPARARLNLTFVKPAAQQAFSLAVSGNSKVVKLAGDAVHRFFSDGTIIAPTKTAADGEAAVPLSKLPEQQRQVARREALMYSVKLKGGAALGSASDLQRPERKHESAQTEHGDSGSAGDGGADSADPTDRAAAAAAAATQPHGTAEARNSALRAATTMSPAAASSVPDAASIPSDVDPWADEPSLHDEQEAQRAQGASSARINGAEPHPVKHVAVPDASDQTDPWADQAQELQAQPVQGFPVQGFAPQTPSAAQPMAAQDTQGAQGAPSRLSTPGVTGASRGAQAAPGAVPMGVPGAMPGAARDAMPGATPNGTASPSSLQPAVPQSAASAMQSGPMQPMMQDPMQAPMGGMPPVPDDGADEYSLDDADISEGMSIEDIAKAFDAKEVRDITEDGNGTV
ncbi:MAG: DNA polymerase III subunit gamma/tau [Bifidobacteriaceae bacterium]|nr:DNA polymerase III subunit gamma/tau [Bifidobacteriaceae bacterium]